MITKKNNKYGELTTKASLENLQGGLAKNREEGVFEGGGRFDTSMRTMT